MRYVERNLIAGERIVYRASLYRLPYLWVVPFVLVAIAGGVLNLWLLAIPALAIAALVWLGVWARRASAEFAVTNHRVIVAVGAMQRRTLELMLGKVEGIGVDQTLVGRLFDYGTVTITGSGGTRESYPNIAAPLEFRRQVQSQLAALQTPAAS